MMYLGDYAAGATVHVPWSSNTSAGAAVTRAVDGSIRIYKNNSTTQRTSANGITDSEDFDSVTGTHLVTIDLSDNTDAGFYAEGNNYHVMLQGATIDSQTVNVWLASFSIKNRFAPIVFPKNVAFSNFLFQLFNLAGIPLTGKADGDFTKNYVIDGGSPGSLSGAISEVDAADMPGWYRIDLTAGELNGVTIALRFETVDSQVVSFTLYTK